jgi:hypothetical protein
MLPLLSLLACGTDADQPFRMNVEAHADDAKTKPFSGRLTVAWYEGQELAIDTETAQPLEAGGATLELAKEPMAQVGFYHGWVENGVGLRVGVLAAIEDDTSDLVELEPEHPTVSTFETNTGISTKVEAWCEDDANLCLHFGNCEDVHDQCYRKVYDCDGESDDSCQLVRTMGEPYHSNRWGKLRGVSEDYLVLHAKHEVPADQLAASGLYLGALEPGYHLVRARQLTGKELDASIACWTRAQSVANDYTNRKKTDIDVDALIQQYTELAGGYDTWWELVTVIATLGLECPNHHVSYELVDPEQAQIDVRLDRMAKPLYGFTLPKDDEALYLQITSLAK